MWKSSPLATLAEFNNLTFCGLVAGGIGKGQTNSGCPRAHSFVWNRAGQIAQRRCAMPPTWDNLSRKEAQCGQGGTIWAAPGYCTSGDVGYYMRGRIRDGWGLLPMSTAARSVGY